MSGFVRRKWSSSWALLVLPPALACGSRTGLGGFSQQQTDGVGADSGVGGVVGTGAAPGSGATFGGGGVLGVGGFPGTGGFVGSGATPGTGGDGFEIPLDCPSQTLDSFVPGQTIVLDVASFAIQPLLSNRWTVHREDCDAILPTPTFTAVGTEGPVLELTPGHPGLYRITLEVVTLSGGTDSCELMVRNRGRGVRVDLCWDTSTTVDLDLYLHTPFNQNPYYSAGGPLFPETLGGRVTEDTCNPANCGPFAFGARPLFDFPDSPLGFCESGPSAADFLGAGHCPNPRSGRDNNQSDATGTSEVVQIDDPRPDDTMRVMVQNFSNLPAVPHVFVYCSEEVVTVELPGAPQNFVTGEEPLPGVLWRAADIFTFQSGGSILCEVTQPAHPTMPGAPYLTVNDDSY